MDKAYMMQVGENTYVCPSDSSQITLGAMQEFITWMDDTDRLTLDTSRHYKMSKRKQAKRINEFQWSLHLRNACYWWACDFETAKQFPLAIQKNMVESATAMLNVTTDVRHSHFMIDSQVWYVKEKVETSGGMQFLTNLLNNIEPHNPKHTVTAEQLGTIPWMTARKALNEISHRASKAKAEKLETLLADLLILMEQRDQIEPKYVGESMTPAFILAEEKIRLTSLKITQLKNG